MKITNRMKQIASEDTININFTQLKNIINIRNMILIIEIIKRNNN